MANPLTGDFDAVLQISGGTVNRLLASMHQNAFSNPKLPSFPHSFSLRIGDDRAVEGVRGFVRAQVGAPRMVMIHGVTDRFRVEIDIRARYKADPGSTPLAEFIHGLVTAEYRLADIDPNCPGWSRPKGNYLWPRVVEESVRFDGVAANPRDPLSVMPLADPDLYPRITRQIARLLARRFPLPAHPVDAQFRKGSMRSLATGGGQAIALGVAAGGIPASGNVASINDVFTGSAGFAVAISRDAVLRLIRPMLDSVQSIRTNFTVRIDLGPLGEEDFRYEVSTGPATVTWAGLGYEAHLAIRIHGRATTPSVAPNFTFDVTQYIIVSFNQGIHGLWLSQGSRQVSVQSSYSIPKSILNNVRDRVDDMVRVAVINAVNAARPAAAGLSSQTAGLTAQLRTFDDQANAQFDSGEFLADGIIMRGAIELARRQPPVASFGDMTDAEGYTAYQSWAPGGRIDSLHWTWSWYGAAPPDSVTQTDRYILQRPVVYKKWGGGGAIGGLSIGERRPLPGLDGNGRICLEIRTSHIDPVTGALVPSSAGSVCRRFGLPIFTGPGLLWRFREPALTQDVPFPELAVADVSSLGGRAANTLLLSVGEEWNRAHEAVLLQALAESRRQDAGLAVVVLFRDGRLERDQDIVRRVESLSERLQAPVLVNEDVMGSWSRTFVLPSGADGWRLISPGGGVTWMRDGAVAVDELVRVLDSALFPSGPPTPVAVSPKLRPGAVISISGLLGDLAELAELPCPPYPKGHIGLRDTIVGFTLSGSQASGAKLAELTRLAERAGENGPAYVAVVTGSPQEPDSRCGCKGARNLTVIEDGSGAVARRFGVSMWPTTLRISSTGTVTSADFGLTAEPVRREN